MALAKGTNSYVTISEADAFFADRLDVAAWSTASETQKAQALITATSILDDLTWIGTVVSESQPLAFPRVGTYMDPKVGYEVSLSETQVPARIINATFELAYHLLNNDGLLDETGEVDSITIGSISLTKVRNAGKIPYAVSKSINPLRASGGISKAWWRAN
jgi:hypothetical protein